MCAFRDCLDINNLREIGSFGHPFTWSNKRIDGFIEEKLDRCVANQAWWTLFPLASVENLVWDGSDHYPIILHLRDAWCENLGRRMDDNRIFRFEARWLQDDGFDAQIRNFWDTFKANRFRQDCCRVVEDCGASLKQWNKDVFLASQNRLGWLMCRLKVVRKMKPTPSVLEEYRRVEKELRELRHQQETVAWQRCRPFVLRNGDRNMAYFHAKASTCRRQNKIEALEDRNGVKHKSREGLKSVVLDYFTNLFLSSRPEITIDQLDCINTRVTQDMETSMARPYSRFEIEAALNEMHPCKSPGPNGLPVLFYKKY
ncbi:unnamed protein product [Amaranthus hypochondriacus]